VLSFYASPFSSFPWKTDKKTENSTKREPNPKPMHKIFDGVKPQDQRASLASLAHGAKKPVKKLEEMTSVAQVIDHARRSPTSTFRTAAHEEAASSRTSVGAEADVEPWDVGGEASSSLQTGIVPAQDQEDYLWTRPRTDDQCGWSRLGRDNIHCRASLGTTVRVPRDLG